MSHTTDQVQQEFKKALAAANTMQLLEQVRVDYLGKKGRVTELLKGMKQLPPEEKKAFGQQVNTLKAAVNDAIANKREQLKAALIEAENNLMPQFDISLPAN